MNNQMFMALVAALLMVLIFPVLFRKARTDAPSGARNFFESILEYLRVEVFRPALKENTDRFLPFLWTLFFFILFCNLLGQLPIGDILTLATGKASHWGGTATGSMITTGALAICAFLFIHVNGVVQVMRSLMDGTYGHHGHHEEHSSDGGPGHEAAHDLEHVRGEGLGADVPGNFKALGNPTKHYGDDEHEGSAHGHAGAQSHAHGKSLPVALLMAVPLYLWNFAPHPFKPEPGQSPVMWLADIPMFGLLLILELVGAVIKPFALMIRLFANMIAGHIVLASLVGLILLGPTIAAQIGIGIPVVVLSLLIRLLELFVAFLQAYIFTFLTTLFLASSVAPEH
ncbi:MAG TPA: F0F1 ATP synthase subunit A [Tepidisphaeraceae bacterium]|nr:F0F1 ATP synthase subunit A [Tepidisphaeraceae bacterium]